MRKYSLLLVSLLFLSLDIFSQTISISEARSKAIGTIVTVSGIASNGAEFGTIRFIQDATAGIAIYDNTLTDIERGDSVVVTGELTEFNGLLEISNVSSWERFALGKEITPSDLNPADAYQESHEGQLVRVRNVTFVQSGNFSGSSANYSISDGSANYQVRILGTTDIAGTPIPSGKISLTGVMGEYRSNYQLQPRSLADIGTVGPQFLSILQQSNIQPFSFTVSWTTDIASTSILRYGPTPALGSEVSDTTRVTAHSLDLSGLKHGSVYYVQGLSIDANGDTGKSNITAMATRSISPGNIYVYFNNPVDTSYKLNTPAHYVNQALADTVIAYINRAKNTIDIAIYNMDNDNGIVTALNNAYGRGVQVRLIAGEGVNSTAYGQLNIGVGNKKKAPPSSQSYGIMHNKFVVIDAEATVPADAYVITGSTNFTNNQINRDPNNMVIFQDQAMARSFAIEFEEMWKGSFGADKADNTPHQFVVGGREVELYFSPSDNTEEHIKKLIKASEKELYFILLIWTRYGLAYDIRDQIRDYGTFAAGIVEDTSSSSFPFNIVAPEMNGRMLVDNKSWIMHHKYAISDPQFADKEPMVLTGSHNWSTAANTRNDENTVIIHDQDISRQFLQEFAARFREAGGGDLLIVTGVEALAGIDLRIFPNPVRNTLFVESSGPLNYRIYNMSGRLMSGGTFNGSGQLGLSEFPAGLYLLKAENGKGTATLRFMIAR